MTTQKEMPGSSIGFEATETMQNILDMTEDEFKQLSKEAEAKMREAVLSGKESIALALWKASDPDGCQAFIDKVNSEAQNVRK